MPSLTSLMTLKEVSQVLHVNPEVLRRWLRNGKMPGFKVGSDWRINAEDLNNFFQLSPSKAKGDCDVEKEKLPKMCIKFPKWLEYSGLPRKLNSEIGHEAWPIFKKLIEVDYQSKDVGERRIFLLNADISERVGYSKSLVDRVIKELEALEFLRLGSDPKAGPYAEIVTPIKTPNLVLDISFSHGGVKGAPQQALENQCLRRYLETGNS